MQNRDMSRGVAARSMSRLATRARNSRRVSSCSMTAAGAERRLVHDQVVRGDAERQPVAMRHRFQRVMAGGDRLDTDRAGGRVGVELPDRAGEELEDTLRPRKPCPRALKAGLRRPGEWPVRLAPGLPNWALSVVSRRWLCSSARLFLLYRPTIPRPTPVSRGDFSAVGAIFGPPGLTLTVGV